ncbi:hypothetical protein [Streptomyces sp. OfavH-34-F]|nr:hypothetical protein [Streptomyces sp. OfavH-34-F]
MTAIAHVAVLAALLAAAVRLIAWALSGEPGRIHHGQDDAE